MARMPEKPDFRRELARVRSVMIATLRCGSKLSQEVRLYEGYLTWALKQWDNDLGRFCIARCEELRKAWEGE